VESSVVANATHGCYGDLLGWQLIVHMMSLPRNSTSDFVLSCEFSGLSYCS
jgi:hypothetical protein